MVYHVVLKCAHSIPTDPVFEAASDFTLQITWSSRATAVTQSQKFDNQVRC